MQHFLLLILLGLTAITTQAAEVLDEIYLLVNNTPITKSHFVAQMESATSRYQALNKTLPPLKQLQKEVLDSIIDRTIQKQIAEKIGITVNKYDIQEALVSIAQANRLTVAQLKSNIVASGIDFNDYLKDFEQEVLISKLHREIVNLQPISEQAVDEYLKTRGQSKQQLSYNIEDIKVSLPEDATSDDLAKANKIATTIISETKSKENIRSIIEQVNDDKYPVFIYNLGFKEVTQIPTVFAEAITKLTPGQYSKPIETENGIHILHLLDTKAVAPKSFEKKRHLFHILIKDNKLDSAVDAKEQIMQIAAELQQGKISFQDMAKAKSHDTESAVKGGEIGWVSSNDLPGLLSMALDNLALKTVSEPIEVADGWHLLYIAAEREEDVAKTRERALARQFLTNKQFEQQIYNFVSPLRKNAYIKIYNPELEKL